MRAAFRFCASALVFVFSFGFAPPLGAAAPPTTPAKPPRVIDITQVDEIEVERLEPPLTVVLLRQARERQSLIRLRWRFDKELVRSADQL